jgi:site-specific recombinase XerD
MMIFISKGKGAKDRMVPISLTLVESLNRYRDERKRLNKNCPEFFTALSRNTGLTDDGLKHLVKNMRTISGMRFTVHKLRHTFATLMLEGGCDIYSLSKMMGHSDIKTTTIYLYASAEHLKAQMMKHPMNQI